MRYPTECEIAQEAYYEWRTAGEPEGFDPQTGLEVSVAIWLHAEGVLTALMNPTPQTPSYEVKE
jgi:hypothetical protein